MKRATPGFRRGALLGILAVIGIAVVSALGTFILGLDERVLGSCGLVVAGCMGLLVVSWGLPRTRQPWLLWTAGALGMVLMCALIALVWLESNMPMASFELCARSAAAVGFATLWALLCGLACTVRFRVWWWHAVPWTALLLVSALAAGAILSVLAPDECEQILYFVGSDLVVLSAAAMGVMGAAALLALPAMAWIDRMPSTGAASAIGGAHVQVHVQCPRCAAQAVIAANEQAQCPACRLALRVEVEEPRCACGYLLHQLHAPTCPECGALLTRDLQWSKAQREPGARPALDPPSP